MCPELELASPSVRMIHRTIRRQFTLRTATRAACQRWYVLTAHFARVYLPLHVFFVHFQYSGTNAEFTKADTVIFRTDLYNLTNGRKEYNFKRTLKYDSKWLDSEYTQSYAVR